MIILYEKYARVPSKIIVIVYSRMAVHRTPKGRYPGSPLQRLLLKGLT